MCLKGIQGERMHDGNLTHIDPHSNTVKISETMPPSVPITPDRLSRQTHSACPFSLIKHARMGWADE
ncbi:hypothetical protein VDGE_30223 [Verticillium dahliae]|uniref:Uncharacterized protein n=1 Tax=Verticillium dahliae TaxID=27337 RepID=A0A444RTN3_VERDA|nr:hypothetical protein VDGE_30223 [Verticillium dahliae]